MKRRWRRVQTAMKNESKKLLWFGATIAAPSAGTCSRPVTRRRNQIRTNGSTSARTIQ
jgi:hypothetical protein